MSGPAAIMGQLVDAKNIAVHKTMRLSIDVPVELAQEVIKAFGWPTMSNPVTVAIARLVDEQSAVKETNESQPTPSKTKGGKLCQRASILCNEGSFRTFLVTRDEELKKHFRMLDTIMAIDEVREICGVQSRSELDSNPEAAVKFKNLELEYKAWMAVA